MSHSLLKSVRRAGWGEGGGGFIYLSGERRLLPCGRPCR